MLERLKSLLGLGADEKMEWAANDEAGDERAYDGLAVFEHPYDHSEFIEVSKNGD